MYKEKEKVNNPNAQNNLKRPYSKANTINRSNLEVIHSHEENDKINFDRNSLMKRANIILEKLKEKDVQFWLNGQKNIWILKPGGKSRGRGIKCISSLQEITSNKSGWNQYVIQKYIENPLIILNRKVNYFYYRSLIFVNGF